ncbi:MAG: hypothetical protein JHC76_08340, partial [Akkermansiaceae bacterium]|nr:hypothetical protein [Akkermansiaceae bacterium]
IHHRRAPRRATQKLQPAGHLLGPDDLLTELKKRFINRILDSELIPQSKAHRRKALEKKPPHSA